MYMSNHDVLCKANHIPRTRYAHAAFVLLQSETLLALPREYHMTSETNAMLETSRAFPPTLREDNGTVRYSTLVGITHTFIYGDMFDV
jgi:hypothetical protein